MGFGHKGREDGTGCTRASNGDTAPLAIDVKLVAEDKSGAKMALCGDTLTNATEVTLTPKKFVDGDSSVMLEFDAYDSFKSNLPSSGKWWLTRDDKVIATEEVAFKAHWRPKLVR